MDLLKGAAILDLQASRSTTTYTKTYKLGTDKFGRDILSRLCLV
ncbi:MAG: hypothetical protein R2728_00800 [Chitinophagales bacterium]